IWDYVSNTWAASATSSAATALSTWREPTRTLRRPVHLQALWFPTISVEPFLPVLQNWTTISDTAATARTHGTRGSVSPGKCHPLGKWFYAAHMVSITSV